MELSRRSGRGDSRGRLEALVNTSAVFKRVGSSWEFPGGVFKSLGAIVDRPATPKTLVPLSLDPSGACLRVRSNVHCNTGVRLCGALVFGMLCSTLAASLAQLSGGDWKHL